MARRIKRILPVCNNYDKFALEEGARRSKAFMKIK